MQEEELHDEEVEEQKTERPGLARIDVMNNANHSEILGKKSSQVWRDALERVILHEAVYKVKPVSSQMHWVTLHDRFWTSLKGDGQELLSQNSVSEANVPIALSEWGVLEKDELVELKDRQEKIRSDFEEKAKEVLGEEVVVKQFDSRKLRRIYYQEDQPRRDRLN